LGPKGKPISESSISLGLELRATGDYQKCNT